MPYAAFEDNGMAHGWLPLWLPLMLAAIPTALLWHRDRRTVKPGHCQKCGYDLRASKNVCPECGVAIDEATRRDAKKKDAFTLPANTNAARFWATAAAAMLAIVLSQLSC